MAGAAPTARPAPFLRPLDLLDRGILLGETALSLVIVAIMVLVAVAESASRILVAAAPSMASFTLPITRVGGDILLNGTIWAAFLGASFATRDRKHLAIDAVGRLLPDRARRIVVGISATLGSIVAFMLAKGIFIALQHAGQSADEQLRSLRDAGAVSGAVDRSYEFHYIIPGGFYLIACRLALHAFHEFLAGFAGYQAAPPVPIPDTAPASHSQPAPISHATLAEVVIAIAALIALTLATVRTTVFGQLGIAALFAIATLAVPLYLRWKATGATLPSVPREAPVPMAFQAQHVVAALAAWFAVGIAARFAFAHVPQIPTAWGVLFFAFMAILGAPLFTFLGGMALFLWLHGSPDVAVMSLPNAVEDALGPHFARMSVLPTIPVFTLAGYLMSESKTPQRLVRVARAFLGWMPGGLAIVCILASAFFTIFSGASGITIVAIGGLLLPALLRDKYPEKFSLGLVTTGGALGITFPPSLPLIVYGIVAGLQEVPPGHERLELQKFMLAGVVPGVLLIGLLAIYAYTQGVRMRVPRSTFNRQEALAALWDAKWELFLPFFLLGGLATGIFNPSQAAAFTAFYVFLIEVFVYKDLSISRDLPRIIPESMVLVGAIFVKLCAATILTAYFIQAQTADKLFEWLTCGPPAQAYWHAHSESIGTCREAVAILGSHGQGAGGIIDSKITFLLALNVFLLVVGMLMDIFSAIVVIVPLIAGIALHFDINPYHLGIVFLINLEIGYLMPPMGLNLFIAGFRFNRPVPDLYRTVLPFIAIFVIALGLTTYIPGLTLMSVPGQHGSDSHTAATSANGAAGPAAVGLGSDGGTSDGAGAGALPPPGNCDTPGESESFDDFERRCNVDTGGGTGTPGSPDAGPSGG